MQSGLIFDFDFRHFLLLLLFGIYFHFVLPFIIFLMRVYVCMNVVSVMDPKWFFVVLKCRVNAYFDV